MGLDKLNKPRDKKEASEARERLQQEALANLAASSVMSLPELNSLTLTRGDGSDLLATVSGNVSGRQIEAVYRRENVQGQKETKLVYSASIDGTPIAESDAETLFNRFSAAVMMRDDILSRRTF